MTNHEKLAEQLHTFEALETNIQHKERDLQSAKNDLLRMERLLEQLITSCGGKPVYYGDRKYHVHNGLHYEKVDGLVILPPEKPRGQPVK